MRQSIRHSSRHTPCAVRLLAAALSLSLSGAAAFADGPDSPPATGAWNVGPVQVQVAGAVAIKVSDYWLGLECHPAADDLRSQLNLPEGQGLVVGQVVPESPAAKAGVKPHDILMAANKKPLKAAQDLIDVTDAAKEGRVSLELLREGKPQELAVTPAKRPPEARPDAGQAPLAAADAEALKKWLDRMMPGQGGKMPMRFQFIHPGAILPPGAAALAPMPENVTITVTKQGEKPAKVVVKRGEEKWDVTEKDLSKLPADLRPYVERLLGRMPMGIVGGVFQPGPEWPQPPEAKPEHLTPHKDQGRLEKRFEEMNQRMDQMRKALDELREKRNEKRSPD